MGLVAALACGAFAGLAGLVSALMGAAAYLLPNALFALRLLLRQAGAGQGSAMTFFVGQFSKLALVVVALMLAGWLAQRWLLWPAVLAGLIGVLTGYVLLPLLAWLRRAIPGC